MAQLEDQEKHILIKSSSVTYEGVIPLLENLALLNVLEPFIKMQNIDVCVILQSKFSTADFKGREVLTVNSPLLSCV